MYTIVYEHMFTCDVVEYLTIYTYYACKHNYYSCCMRVLQVLLRAVEDKDNT